MRTSISLMIAVVGTAFGQLPDSNTSTMPKTFKYKEGTPGCQHAFLEGYYWQLIETDNVRVAVSPTDNGKKLIIHLGVFNDGKEAVDVLPTRITVTMIKPKRRELKWEDPVKLAKAIQSSAERWSRFDAAMAQNQTQQVTTQSSTSGQSNANVDYYGMYGRTGGAQAHGTYNEQTGTVITMPNWSAQQQAQLRIAGRMANATDAVESIRAFALKPQTIQDGQSALGDVYFERDRAIGKTNTVIVIRVSVGDTAFEFPFTKK